MRINLIDVDGTLCPSIFINDRLKNDNKNCLTPEFLKDLAEVVPYEWWDYDTWDGDVCILVTGRLPVHEQLTIDWFCKHGMVPTIGPAAVSYVSVPWDDTCSTREESYADYVRRKTMKLTDIIDAWLIVQRDANIPVEIHVYEDDTNVLKEIGDRFTYPDSSGYQPHPLNGRRAAVFDDDTTQSTLAFLLDTDQSRLHVVDKQGEVHDYP